MGIDVGATFTAAAVERDGNVTVQPLSLRASAIPSVVFVDGEGGVLVGDAALRRAIDEPHRIAREMKRRIGDPVPMLVGGQPWTPELLQAQLLRWVVDQTTAEQGERPESVVITHPASWAAFKLDLFAQAARQVGLDHFEMQPEPVAAATWYASEHRLAEGGIVAVYDLGGGTFDAAVVRRTGATFQLLGRPDGVERLGGVDFDAAVLDHVTASLGLSLDALDDRDPEVMADVADLRVHCVAAKEALSADTTASIPVRLPGIRTTVRLNRSELENAIRRPLLETIVAMRRTLDSAGVAPADLSNVLLVGGSSRIPLVAQLITAELGTPVALDANPKLAIALGAAILAARSGAELPRPAGPAASAPARAEQAPAAADPIVDEPAAPAGTLARARPRIPAMATLTVGALAAAALLVAAALRGDGSARSSSETVTAADAAADEDLEADATGVAADGVLRIGVVLPTEDPISPVAAGLQAGAQLAVDDLNAAGGVLGTPVELVVVDSDELGTGAVNRAMNELLAAGVDVVVGPPDRRFSGIVGRTVSGGRAGCSPVDPRADTLENDDGRFVQTIPNEFVQAGAIAAALVGDGRTTAAVVAPDDTGTFRNAVIAAIESEGITVDPVIRYERGALDAVAAVQQLNGGPGQTTIVLGDEALAELVAEGARQGYLGPFYGDETLTADAFGRRALEALGSGVEVLPITVASAPSGADDSIQRRAEELAGTFPAFAPYVYDCVVLAAVAAEAADSDSPDAIVAELAGASSGGEPCALVGCVALAAAGTDVDYEGASGPVDLDSDGDVSSGRYDRWRWDPTPALVHEGTIDV